MSIWIRQDEVGYVEAIYISRVVFTVDTVVINRYTRGEGIPGRLNTGYMAIKKHHKVLMNFCNLRLR